MSKIGFVICSRTDSERLPNKPFRLINDVPVIEHLVKRLQKTGLPVYIAYPKSQENHYVVFKNFKGVFLHPSDLADCPLSRTVECGVRNKLTTVIRVTHDKIFVEENDVKNALTVFNTKSLDYLFGSKFLPGSGFEVISMRALKAAAEKYKNKNVEFISYAVREVTDNSFDYDPRHPKGNYRFLIDFPEDLKFFEALFSQIGTEATLGDAVKYLNVNPEIKQINSQPVLTVYTCAYNADKFLETCLESVARQKAFPKIEYILIDDCSTDKTCEIMAKFSLKHKNVSWVRNQKNLGLASSSNIALKSARGKYILRLDADDFFVSISALDEMLSAISDSNKEVIYPDNYFGSYNKIQRGDDCHHAGGAIFDKRAINHIKFTDGLRGHDSLDIFLRAKDSLKVGYLQKPMFFYTQREGSLSKTNPKLRAKIKEKILDAYDDDVSYGFDYLRLDS